jgi:hypothetical protein
MTAMPTRLPNLLAPLLAGIALTLVACASDTTGATDDFSSRNALSSGSGAGTSASGQVRVRCEKRANRSKISVDGRSLSAGNYAARVSSGSNQMVATFRPAVAGEAEFDFDSNQNDIAAGATAIGPSFIVINGSGPEVTGELLDAAGNVVDSLSVECRVR